MEKLLDIYTDYLQVSFGQATATGLSRVLDGSISHDKITRFLSSPARTSKDLWHFVKPLVRKYESDDGCIIFDDTIIAKPHTDESDLICWHFDHSSGRSVKGINLLSAFYHTSHSSLDQHLRIPICYDSILKPVKYIDPKSGKQKRKSEITKNMLLRNQLQQCIGNSVKFKYVLADSWYSSAENMRFIDGKGKCFIFDLKRNRQVAQSKEDQQRGRFQRIDSLSIQADVPVYVYLKGLHLPLVLIKHVFTNKDGSSGERYLVSNDLSLTNDDLMMLYKKRWSIEEYHKSIKQNTAITKSPTRRYNTQANHLFSSLVAYVKLEIYKLKTRLNHFALRAKLLTVAAKAAYQQIENMKQNAEFI